MIHQFPQGTLYDLNAFCAWQDPALLLGGFTGTELTLIGLSAWAWVASLAAIFFWYRGTRP